MAKLLLFPSAHLSSVIQSATVTETATAKIELRSDAIANLYDAIGDLLTAGESAAGIADMTTRFTDEIAADLADEAGRTA
jgi:hypothetical protein